MKTNARTALTKISTHMLPSISRTLGMLKAYKLQTTDTDI